MNLQEKYKKVVIPAMKEKFGYKNDLQVPRLEKVVVNVGLSQGIKDPKFVETVQETLKRITGQKPVAKKARKSISNFKIRKGQDVGMMVTLRGKRMYDFTDKLVNLSLPRVRDFRGLSVKALDSQGNLSIGFRENIAFPEINPNEVERLHGLEVTVATTAKNNEEGLEFFKRLGFPFR
jgi:large subunit ribosomal protein L5